MKLLLVIILVLMSVGIADATYLNDQVFGLGNGAYITVNTTTINDVNQLACCDNNELMMRINGSMTNYTAGANKTITSVTFNNVTDNFTIPVTGVAGYLNFSTIMANASNSYNLTANGVFVESRNTTSDGKVWFNYTGDATLSVTWNSSTGGAEPPVVNGSPAITSNLNNHTNNAATSFTADINEVILFSVGANQSVTWTWTGATEGAGDGTANSTATKQFTTSGVQYVNVSGTNANGSTSLLTWTVTVSTEGGGGGANLDYLTGTCSPNGATIATNPNVGSATCTAGTYTFGYVFDRAASPYWINVSMAGYTSNNSQVVFNEDHEIWNLILTETPTSNVVITGYTPSSPTTVRTGNDISFEVTESSNVDDYHWTYDGASVGDTSGLYTKTFIFNSSKHSQVHSVTVYGTNGTNMSNTITWSVTVLLAAIKDYDFDKNFSDIGTSELNPVNLSVIGASPYVNGAIGSIFWGVIFALIFIMIWMRQEDVTIPSILGLIIGLSMWSMMPKDWVSMASSLSIISFFGIMYTLIKGRR